jgi:4-hydroxy-3-polyprenylbenzoate decarboxylase
VQIESGDSARVLVGITGASGIIYAERLVEQLLINEHVGRIYLLFSQAGEKVAQHELKTRSEGFSLVSALRGKLSTTDAKKIRILGNDNLFAPVASGTSAPTHMVVVPCSMGTLARVATGISGNLLERTADVMLKQRRPLVLVPRETPLSSIHLKNMLILSDLGVQILPAMPGFYFNPKSLNDLVNFIVGRIFESMQLDHQLYKPWNHRMR